MTGYKIEKQPEKIYERMFIKHYPPSNPIWDSSWMYRASDRSKVKSIETIKKLLLKGYDVKAGWCGSSMVRTYREYFIFYK
jgi:hypothetical protein